jgi:hypothetical protein
MRVQYHAQQTSSGLLVWDVRRLIRPATDLPISRVPLSEIWELDRVRWFDNGEPPTCRELLEHMRLVLEADTSHPILLGSDGRVMDGMHRVLKVALAGDTSIEAKRFDLDPPPDYVDVSLSELPYDDEPA